jgi:hypothetical protein
MSQKRWTNILRYTHCDPLDESAPGDGVALLWYRDEEARLRHVGDEMARATMRADEAETFARPVREFSILVDEVIFASSASAAIKRFDFVWRAPSMSRAEFRQWWERDYGPRRLVALAALPGFLGLVQNHAHSAAELAGFGLDCDGIEESDWAAPIQLRGEPSANIGRSMPIWTREVVLSDARDHA